MKELACVIKPLVCIICGDKESFESLKKVKGRLRYNRIGDDAILRFPLIVVDSTDTFPDVFSEFPSLTDSSSLVLLRVSSKEPRVCSYFPLMLRLITGFHYVEVLHLRALTLSYADLDPSTLRLPNLEEIQLSRCYISSKTQAKLNFPSLTKFTSSHTFNSINAHLDYKNTPLIKMKLLGITDLPSWNGIHCPTLEELEISDIPDYDSTVISSITDVRLENLKSLVWSGCQTFRSLNNVYFGKVESLNQIDDSYRTWAHRYHVRQLSLNNLEAPSTKTLSLTFDRTLNLSKIVLPNVEEVSMSRLLGELTKEDVDSMDLGFLQSVKTLRLRNASAVVPYATSLVKLNFNGRPPAGPLKLPNLQTLGVDNFDDIYNTSLTNISQITTLYVLKSSKTEHLHLISLWYPNIKILGIKLAQWGHVRGLKMKNLEVLHAFISGKLSLSFKGCEFESLTDLNLKALHKVNLECFELLAPSLTHMVLENMSADELVLKNLVALRLFWLGGPIKFIKFENSIRSLEYFCIEHNQFLTYIESDEEFEKLVRVEGVSVPFTNAIKNIRPSCRWYQKLLRRTPKMGKLN